MKKITDRRIKNYNDYLIGEEKSKNTISKYMRDVTAFAKWLKDKALNKSAVLEYKEHLRTYLTNTILTSTKIIKITYNAQKRTAELKADI